MITTLFRIIRYGFLDFWRNGWLSTATVIIMALALLMFQGLILFDVMTSSAIDSIRDKIDIAVYFKPETVEDDILKIQRSLRELSEVKEVSYISSDEALANFKDRHKDDPTINQALTELEDNPLLASLNIKAKDSNDYSTIAGYLENDDFSPAIERVTFAQNRTAIERLNKIIETVNKIGFAVTIFIAFVASLVVFNTIRLAIYSNRSEIGIMRLVGASNIFTKGPYIVSGILYGVIGGVLALIVAFPMVNFITPYFAIFVPELSLQSYFTANFGHFFWYLLGGGVLLGMVSSWVAIRRYLKV